MTEQIGKFVQFDHDPDERETASTVGIAKAIPA